MASAGGAKEEGKRARRVLTKYEVAKLEACARQVLRRRVRKPNAQLLGRPSDALGPRLADGDEVVGGVGVVFLLRRLSEPPNCLCGVDR